MRKLNPNEKSMRVEVRCKDCGRLICYKVSAASGFVEFKCTKCGKIALVNLSLRKARKRVNYRSVQTVDVYIPKITIRESRFHPINKETQ